MSHAFVFMASSLASHSCTIKSLRDINNRSDAPKRQTGKNK